MVIGAEVLDAEDRRTNKRWGKAVRRALNELVRCYEESERQRRRIRRVLTSAERGFDQLKTADLKRKRQERRVRSN